MAPAAGADWAADSVVFVGNGVGAETVAAGALVEVAAGAFVADTGADVAVAAVFGFFEPESPVSPENVTGVFVGVRIKVTVVSSINCSPELVRISISW